MSLSRRDFLERAALTSAVLACARPAAAADTMFVSLNGAVTRGVSGADKARLAAKVGFGGVDWDFGPAKTAGLDATKALFAELKIKPTIANLPMARPLPFGGEQSAFDQALTQLADDAAFCAAIGCQKMMVVLPATSPVPKDEFRKTVVESTRGHLASASEIERTSRRRVSRRAAVQDGTSRRASSHAFHLESAGDHRACEGQRSEHRHDSRRLALAPLGQHDQETSSPPATTASSMFTCRMRRRSRRKKSATISA